MVAVDHAGTRRIAQTLGLILAAAAFHKSGHTDVVDIQDAYHLLDPLVGGALASVLFGVALLASGQSSTFTGTIAGQVIMEGYLNLRIPCWQRRLITRGLALIPAFIGVWLMGEFSTDLGSIPLSGNFGVRYVRTVMEAANWVNTSAPAWRRPASGQARGRLRWHSARA